MVDNAIFSLTSGKKKHTKNIFPGFFELNGGSELVNFFMSPKIGKFSILKAHIESIMQPRNEKFK